jgi:hypothetical protein
MEPSFEVCWSCGTPMSGAEDAGLVREQDAGSPRGGEVAPAERKPPEAAPERAHQVSFKIFRSSYISWEELFRQAADFAGSLERDQLISISHSEDQNDGVVTVWYWEQAHRAT